MSIEQTSRSRLSALMIFLLTTLVLGTGVWVVAAKHEARQLFAELEELNREQDRLQVDWGRLQLEQSTYATHPLIETLARERLRFRLPDPRDVRVVSSRQQ